MLKDLRAVLSWVDARLQFRWALLVPVMGIAAVLEAFAAMAVFGLLRLVVEPHRVRITPIASQIWQAWPTDNPTAVLGVVTTGVALFYVLRALYVSWAEWVKESTIAASTTKAADRLFSRFLSADYPFHLRRRSSELIQEIARSTDVAFQLFLASLLNITTEVVTILALAAVLIITAPARTLIAVAVVLAAAAMPMVMTRRVWTRAGEDQKALEEKQLHVLQQSLGAVKEVKIAGREAFFESRLRATRRSLARVKQRRSMFAHALRLGIETVLIVSMLGVVLLVTMRGASGSDTVAILALFAYVGFRIVPSVNRIMLNAGYMREARAFVAGAIDDFKALKSPGQRAGVPEPVVEFSRSLACDDVSFAYDDGAVPALSHVNVMIKAGESVGIVGETGSGKSTLVDILLGLLRPTSGHVLIDGANLAGRERAWQRMIGYVPQDPYLLDDSVRRNVAFGVNDSTIDEQRLAKAVSLAQLDDVVKHLPQGLDTPIGENGTRLSGGQRQRVAIARALYSEPAVLVFDEATAALDNQTEREVTGAIASLHGSRTLIVIAHRLSTVENCDRLILLQHGRVVATGTYNELLGNPVFRTIAPTR